MRRLLAGFFARQKGRGGIVELERITGIDRNTVAKGLLRGDLGSIGSVVDVLFGRLDHQKLKEKQAAKVMKRESHAVRSPLNFDQRPRGHRINALSPSSP